MFYRVWDEADYVVPPAENGAFFVTTNVVITPNQTWGHCPEVLSDFHLTACTFWNTYTTYLRCIYKMHNKKLTFLPPDLKLHFYAWLNVYKVFIRNFPNTGFG